MGESKSFIWLGEEGSWYQPGLAGENGARVYFWNQYQMSILTLLQKDLDEGWIPVTEIGPAGFIVKSYEVVKSNISFFDVVLWFVTFFIYFLIQLISGGLTYKVTRYEVKEFRVLLRR
jgi:hypothetical protein